MIQLHNIDKHFGSQHVLKDVSLHVPPGQVTALIGLSGSGKSTLLRCINLLETPSAGQITLGDASLQFGHGHAAGPSGHSSPASANRHGVPELPAVSAPHRAGKRDGRPAGGEEMAACPGRSPRRELLQQVGMAHKADAWPGTLSGGQQQRVAIARALAQSPGLLLCDEPTSALDPELASEVVAVLRQLAANKMTMLIATHDLRLAATLADTVVFLEDGRIVEQGSSVSVPAAAKPAYRQLCLHAEGRPAGNW
jgi:cystine transport system ATP-binding protein